MGLLLILLAGCAAERTTVFERPGITDAQLKKDQATCFRASITGEDPVVSNLLQLDRDAYRRCMESRGYTVRIQG